MQPTIEEFRGKYRWLSNFALVDVVFNDYVYRSVEHAYQAAKTTNEDDRFKIANAPTPGDAKRLGRTVPMRADWEAVKVYVMNGLLCQKFAEAPYKSLLLATGDAVIIEGNNWGDTFWGRCRGVGLNRLGQLIMDIRADLLRATESK